MHAKNIANFSYFYCMFTLLFCSDGGMRYREDNLPQIPMKPTEKPSEKPSEKPTKPTLNSQTTPLSEQSSQDMNGIKLTTTPLTEVTMHTTSPPTTSATNNPDHTKPTKIESTDISSSRFPSQPVLLDDAGNKTTETPWGPKGDNSTPAAGSGSVTFAVSVFMACLLMK